MNSITNRIPNFKSSSGEAAIKTTQQKLPCAEQHARAGYVWMRPGDTTPTSANKGLVVQP